MYFWPILLNILLLYIFLSVGHHNFIAFVNPGSAALYYINDVAINCGSLSNSNALDGREWAGESASKFASGKSRTSTVSSKSLLSPDPVPYMTSRISATPFQYTFHVSPGQKFIRLHFYPASYRGFGKSRDLFTVKSGPFTLLRDFSASLTAETLGVKHIVKEFCVNVGENMKLNVTFAPSLSRKFKKIHAFVNGIEIVSMPTGLYYTPDGDLGAPVVGQKNGFYVIDNSTALEVIERLNIGGSYISSGEDFGMFRRWREDTSYLLESRVERVNHPVLGIKYTNMPAFVAPPKIYQTSWRKGGNKIRVNGMNNFAWKIPVELGFGYLVRLHFCEIDDVMVESEQRGFSVLINNQIAETQADVIRWSGGNGIPVYKDYMVKMKGENEGSMCDLLIALQSVNELVLGVLNGLEIFKLSNLDNSLATPNPTSPRRVSSSWNLRIQKWFFPFGQSNVTATTATILIILVNIIVYNLRQFWEQRFNLENDEEAAATEACYHHFSLAEIISATQNFSHAFVLGRGGFGKVYKGFIRGISETVAIKRLNFYSRQGAREFWTEIETLSKLRHIHLVSLIGYCEEDEEMILVYEYMPCGTLADNLYKMRRKGKDIAPLSWEQRLRICIGAARGLEYLHNGTEYGIIHRDVKDSNILLDENLVAKISDFGLSKLEMVTQSKSYVSTKVKGTVGYFDPDYIKTHRLTRKSDVYAFGVVLLVVLAGRPAVDTRTPEEPQSLLSCFREYIAEGNVNQLIDESLLGKISSDSLKEFVKIVENCVRDLPKKRPTMAQVVASLEQALQQQENPISSAPEGGTVVSQPLKEGNLESHPPVMEDITTQTRERDHARHRRLLWGWPWKAIWNRGCISSIIAFTSPKDACRAAVISVGFKSASNSDTVWENFLPSDYKEIMSESVISPSLDYATKKELYFHLCHSPILINDGTLSFWLNKLSGKKCYMLCARELSIAWKDAPMYWSWTSIPESRFSEVAELLGVCWLDIRGKMQAEMLSPKTNYAAYLVFKTTEDSYGLDTVAKASIGFAGGNPSISGTSTSTSSNHVELKAASVYLKNPRRPVSRARRVLRHQGEYQIDGWIPCQRNDGWLELFLGEFFNHEGDGEIEIQVSETKVLNWKKGLILEGIELRPNEIA